MLWCYGLLLNEWINNLIRSADCMVRYNQDRVVVGAEVGVTPKRTNAELPMRLKSRLSI